MEQMRFANWVGIVGVIGGVVIALGFPFMILYFGDQLSGPGPGQTILIIFGLLVGVALAAASAVIGITVPTAISEGGIDIEKLARCCEDEEEKGDEADSQESMSG
jgi:hypothetical protein